MCDGHSDAWIDVNGKQVGVDHCIADVVQMLNDHGLTTVASCCGHGTQPTSIALADGRWVLISRDDADGRAMQDVFAQRWLAERLDRLERHLAVCEGATPAGTRGEG